MLWTINPTLLSGTHSSGDTDKSWLSHLCGPESSLTAQANEVQGNPVRLLTRPFPQPELVARSEMYTEAGPLTDYKQLPRHKVSAMTYAGQPQGRGLSVDRVAHTRLQRNGTGNPANSSHSSIFWQRGSVGTAQKCPAKGWSDAWCSGMRYFRLPASLCTQM